MRTIIGLATVGIGSTAAIGMARAEEPLSAIGVALMAGGGVEDFTGESMRKATTPAGTWDVRAAIGTRYAVSGELAYLGSASRVDALFGGRKGTLVSHGAEALIRSDFVTADAWQSYAFLGAAWRHYTVTDADFRMSDSGMNDSDAVLEFPMGVGASYRYRGFLVDARATFRAAAEEDLALIDDGYAASGDYATMHTWSISARLGYEL